MGLGHLQKLDAYKLAGNIDDDWRNFRVCQINDHAVSISVIKEGFGVDWHSHPEGDELLYVAQGMIYLDLEDRTEQLTPGQMMAISKGVRHRTRAGSPSVVICFDHADSSPRGTQPA